MSSDLYDRIELASSVRDDDDIPADELPNEYWRDFCGEAALG